MIHKVGLSLGRDNKEGKGNKINKQNKTKNNGPSSNRQIQAHHEEEAWQKYSAHFALDFESCWPGLMVSLSIVLFHHFSFANFVHICM